MYPIGGDRFGGLNIPGKASVSGCVPFGGMSTAVFGDTVTNAAFVTVVMVASETA